MKKTYVLDTNVLLTDPSAIFSFEEHDVVLPFTVLEELDRFKTRQDELGVNARETNRRLSVLIKTATGNLKTGLELPGGGYIRAVSSSKFNPTLPTELNPEKNDNFILSVCADIEGSILVTNDLILRVIADGCGITAEEYKKLSVADSIGTMYRGIQEIHVEKEQLADLWHQSRLGDGLTEEIQRIAPGALPNEFVYVRNGERSKPFIVRTHEDYVKFVPEEYELPKIKPRNIEQRLALDLLMDPKVNLVTCVGKAGTGKASPIDTPTLTPTGWKKMGDIKSGDFVISVDGNPTKVLATFPQGYKKVFKVTFSDGTSVKCCKEHLWETKTSLERNQGKPGKVRTTEEIMSSLRYGKQQKKNHSIPMVSSVQFAKQEIPIDPYVLGIMLGDGSISTKTAYFTTSDLEIASRLKENLNSIGDILKEKKTNFKTKFEFYITRNKRNNQPANLVQKLRDLNLMGCVSSNKFIPKSYKYNSAEVRLALLQGLMDTDGTVSKNGTYTSFTSTSEKLASDVQEIVWSFGGKATITKRVTQYTYNNIKKNGKPSYRVSISLPPKIYPFKLVRKLLRYKPRTKYQPTRYITDINFAGVEESVCLLVDHPRHLYVTKDYIVTHNTLLALAAGIEQVVDKGKYKSLIVLRPVQPLGKDIGFLPGPQPLDAGILTPNGWTTMGKINIGDEVIAKNGLPTKVLNVFPKGKKKIYRITTTDGTSTEACEDHLWYTQTAKDRKRKRKGNVKTTKEIIETLQTDQGKNNHFLPRNEPVHYYESQPLPVAPYTLGCLLGDGSISSSISIISKDEEIIERMRRELLSINCVISKPHGLQYNIRAKNLFTNKPARPIKLTYIDGQEKIFNSIGEAAEHLGMKKSKIQYRCLSRNRFEDVKYEYLQCPVTWQNPLKEKLFALGLIGSISKTKFIPEQYKFASIQSRIALLQGLMDTDGTIKKNGEASFATTSQQLAKDVAELVQSLGGRAKIRSRNRVGKNNKLTTENRIIYSKNISYEFTISLPTHINPFYIKRKAQRHKCSYIKPIGISSVEPVGIKEAQCILVDNKEHLYLTDNFIVTHNSKEEKMEPWIAPIKDNLRFLLTSDGGKKSKNSEYALSHYFDRGIIEVEAMTYIRGRSIADAYMIIDEAQNLSAHELKTIITRVGSGTKIVLTGDIEQIDNVYVDSVSNGLAVAVERFKKHSIAGHMTLTRGERSKLASLAAEIL